MNAQAGKHLAVADTLKREGLLESRSGSGSYLTFAARNAAGAIGVIAPDYHKIDFFTDLCDGIANAARAEGYDTLLGDVSAPEAHDRGRWALAIAKAYASRRMVGVLLEPVDLIPGSHEATKKVLAVLEAKKIPVVLLDRDYLPPPERSAYDLVGIDNVQSGYRLAKHMIDSGARNIRFLTQPNYASTIRGRIQGVAQAVDAWQRPPRCVRLPQRSRTSLCNLFLHDVVIGVGIVLGRFVDVDRVSRTAYVGDSPEDAITCVVIRADDGVLLRA